MEMIGRRSVIGLSLLCALLLSAIGVANASAAGTRAFTCKPGSTLPGFKDEHCTEAAKSASEVKFVHSEIPPGTATKFKATNNETGTTTSLQILKGTLAGVEVELSATGAVAEGTITNKEVSGVMQNIGEGITVKYTGVKVTKPAGLGCKVKNEELTTNSLKSTTAEGTTPATTGAVFSPTSGTEFISIPLEGCSVEGLNKAFPVTGSATGDPHGATLEFTKESTKNLVFGGAAASLTGKITTRMAPTTPPTEENPITYTTTTP